VFYKIQIVPDHFWMARRFLSVILPAAFLLVGFVASYGVTAGTSPDRSIRGRSAVGLRVTLAAVFIGLMAWTLSRSTAAILDHVEYAGLIPRIEHLASRFQPDDLIVVESRNSSDLHIVALPLAYIYARNVLVLNSPRPDKATFRLFLAWARDRYRDIYFLGGGGTDLLSKTIGVVPIDSERFQVPEYQSLRNAYPRAVSRKEFDFGLYRFTDPQHQPGDVRIDVGTLDDLNVVRFHAKERNGDRESFRWSRDASYVMAVGVQPTHRTVTMSLNDGRRPSTVTPAMVTVSFDGRDIGRAIVGDGFREYTFTLPADLAEAAATREEPALLKISVNTWNPRRAAGSPDDRDLGVMVDRVDIR
jgi:hypothetical protein